MDAGQIIAPGGAQQTQDVDPRTLQAVLLRMSPEERAAMFEPYQDELSILNQQAQPQQHTTAGGALFSGLGNMFASMDRKDMLQRKQADAMSRANARYGPSMDQNTIARQAMADALRKMQTQPTAATGYEFSTEE